MNRQFWEQLEELSDLNVVHFFQVQLKILHLTDVLLLERGDRKLLLDKGLIVYQNRKGFQLTPKAITILQQLGVISE